MGAKGLRKGEPMSIILKGIDLDEITAGNGYARLEIEEDGTVVDDISDIIIAQAIQIDRPHGRLMDADLFKELIKDSVPSWTIGVKIPTYGDMDIMGKIGCMPTILEAEE